MIEVKLILPNDCYHIRHLVLRPNDPLSFSEYPSDNQQDDFHLGAFYGEELIGVASYFVEKSQRLHFPNQSRLRGLAVLPEFRKKGAGMALVERAFDIVKGMGNNIVWAASSPDVCAFFLKLGFIELPEVYQTEVGPQKLVYRKL